MKTQAAPPGLEKYRFDAAFGGARPTRRRSAKEAHFFVPPAQPAGHRAHERPERWSLYNARKRPGESLRVFPLSNWPELDVWQIIWLSRFR